MAAPLTTLAGMNAILENLMDSEAGIVEVVLGTEFQTMTGENKTRYKNRRRQFARKVGPSDNSVRYSVYDSLDRLATASERTSSFTKLQQ